MAEKTIEDVLLEQYRQIVKLQSETMVTQLLLGGFLRQFQDREGGRKIVESAFDFAEDTAIASATAPGSVSDRDKMALKMLEQWRTMLLK